MTLYLNALLFLVVLLVQSKRTCSSLGDSLPVFQDCLVECLETACNYRVWGEDDDDAANGQASKSDLNSANIPFHMRLLGWKCSDECRHECQWTTIEELRRTGVPERQMPQFFGKWTFVRVMGIQEPASMLFSLANAYTTWAGWRSYAATVMPALAASSALVSSQIGNGDSLSRPSALITLVRAQWEFALWTIVALLSGNAWLWSALFHCHDTKTTEKMDYFSGFGFVLASFAGILIKLMLDHLDLSPVLEPFIRHSKSLSSNQKSNVEKTASLDSRNSFEWIHNRGLVKLHAHVGARALTLCLPAIGYYAYHTHYMAVINFDYGFNMRVNVSVGICSSISWIFWAAERYLTGRWNCRRDNTNHGTSCAVGAFNNYLVKCLVCVVGVNVLLLLEVFDFAPLWYVFDAHALWHAGTAPAHLLWFSFLRDEFRMTYERELLPAEAASAKKSTNGPKVANNNWTSSKSSR